MHLLPGAMLCPILSPWGLDGVLQSIVTSLRMTLSMSTALKNATDWCDEKRNQLSLWITGCNFNGFCIKGHTTVCDKIFKEKTLGTF